MQSMAVYLCCTCPEVTFGGCYPLSCPIKPGLSSYTAFRHCARGCSAYSDSYYTQSILPLSSGVPPLPYSPRLYGLFAPVLRCWQASTGRGCFAILAKCRRKSWLDPPGQRKYGRPDTGPPPGGWKKVGEKPSFSPKTRGGVTFRHDSYFGPVPK